MIEFSRMIELLLAIAVFLLIPICIIVFKLKLVTSAAIGVVFTLLVVVLQWNVGMDGLITSATSGGATTLEILLILLGALILIENSKAAGTFTTWEQELGKIFTDRVALTLVFAFFLSSLLEGIAGFGTPVAIIAPILVGLGYKPLKALTLALLGNSTAVTFGALGTPLLVGIGQGAAVADGAILREVALLAVIFHAIAAFVIVYAISKLAAEDLPSANGVWKVSVTAAAAFAAAYLISVLVLPLELVSVATSLLGLGLFTLGYSLQNSSQQLATVNFKQLVFSSTPILLVIAALLVLRFLLLPLAGRSIFTSPGAAIVLAGLLIVLFTRKKGAKVDWKQIFGKLIKPGLTLLCVVVMAQLIINSGSNSSGLEGIPEVLAANLVWLGDFYPLVSGVLALAGTFVSGSATVSNLLFSGLQLTTAQTIGLSSVAILAIQAFASAVANPVALTNIAAGQATVDVPEGQESKVLAATIKVVLLAIAIASVLVVFYELIA